MFTVKLMKAVKDIELPNAPSPGPIGGPVYRFSTRLVEATEVIIHTLRAGELYEVATTNGDHSDAFYICDHVKGRPAGFADDVDFYYAAFIENAAGRTTDSVRF